MDIEDQGDIPAPANKAGFRATLLIIGLAFVAGTAAMGWGISRWDTGREWLLGKAPDTAAPATPTISYAPETPEIAAPLPAESGLALAALEARLAKLETVSGASTSSPRAEAMLTAFAARRAIDRGLSLGALEPLLSQHFGATQPRAVAVVIDAARHPINSSQLLTEFASIKSNFTERPSEQGWWDSLTSGLTQLVTIRDENAPSADPQLLIAEADQLLGQGRVEQALALIAKTPNRAAASEWTSRARRYVETQRAIDLIEDSAFTISK
jgi:hypothetical protein